MYTVYSKDACPFCVQAKTLLTQKNLDFREIKLGKDITLEALLEACEYYGHGRTMPLIVKEDEFGNVERIGGFTELKASLS